MRSPLLDDQENLLLLRDLVHYRVVATMEFDFLRCDDLRLVLPQVKVPPERPIAQELVPLLALVTQVERDLAFRDVLLCHPLTSIAVEVWGVEDVWDVEYGLT